MKTLKFLILWLVFFCANQVNAQDLAQVQRWIKAGNSLREAQLYEQAENYLQKGLSSAQKLNNTYWEAAAAEYLGLLYANIDDIGSATTYFNRALRIYESLKKDLSIKAVTYIMGNFGIKPAVDEGLYGGIDIGSKGVKYAVIRISRVNGSLKLKILKSGSFNPQLIDFTPQAIEDASEGTKRYIDTLKQNGISDENIFVAVSSGVKQEADKDLTGNREAQLRQSLAQKLNNYSKSVEFLLPCKEGGLSLIGVMPSNYLYSGSLIDVGSGNTKGGYYELGKDIPECFSLPWGTVSTSKAISASDQNTSLQLFNDKVSADVSYEVNRKAVMKNRRYVCFTGGITWSMCNFLHPEGIKDSINSFTKKDVDKFVTLAMNNYNALINPDLSSISDYDELRTAQQAINSSKRFFLHRSKLLQELYCYKKF